MRTVLVALVFLTSLTPALDVAAPLPPSAVRMTITRSQLAQQHPTLSVTLPGGRAIEFRTELERPAPGMLGLRGWSAGSDRLNLFSAAGVVEGDLYATGGRYRLVQRGEDLYWTPAGELAPETDRVELLQRSSHPVAAGNTPAPKAAAAYTVDLLVLYQPAFGAAYAQGAKAKAQRLVFLANTFLANSSIPLHYNVVGIEQFDAGPIATMADFSGNPEVKRRRNERGADLVTYLTAGSCASFASAFNSGQETPDGQVPQFVNPETDAFSVVNQAPNCREDTLAHELGHNVGAGHDFGAGATLEWKDYAHGWDCGNAGPQLKYASVMHYGYVVVEARGDFFSTPNLVLDGERCGSDGPIEPLKADNARAIAQAIPYVAAYRDPKSDGGGGAAGISLLAVLLALRVLRRGEKGTA